jgi:hypothetical protein
LAAIYRSDLELYKSTKKPHQLSCQGFHRWNQLGHLIYGFVLFRKVFKAVKIYYFKGVQINTEWLDVLPAEGVDQFHSH